MIYNVIYANLYYIMERFAMPFFCIALLNCYSRCEKERKKETGKEDWCKERERERVRYI